MRKVIIITAINSNVNHVILTVPHAIQEVKLVVLVILIVLNKNVLLAVLMDSIKIVLIIFVSLVIRNASPAMEEQFQIV